MGAVERFTSFFVGEASVRKTPEREAANDAAFEVKPVTLDDVKQRGMWTNAKGENVRVNPDTMTIEKYANGGTIFFGSLEDMRKDLEQGPYTLVLSQVASEKTVPDDGDIVVAEAVNDPIVAVSQKGGQKTIDRGKARGAKGERNRSKKQGGRGGNGGPGDGDGTDDVAEMDRLLANATTPEETKTLSGVAFVPNIQPLALAKKENVSPAAAPAVSKPAEVVDMATHETGEVPAPTQVEVAPEWRKKLDEFLGRPDGEGLAQKIGEIIVSERKQFNIKIVEKIQKKGEFVTSKREWETWNTSMAPALKRFIAKEYFSYLGIDDNTGKKIVGGIRRFLNEEAKNSSTQGDDVFEQRRMPKDVVYLGEKEYEALVTEAIA
ncbi:MAG: hypothetical protein Q8O53_02425, partial [Candidatus Moranbacteria bacterium]|nr:hypothetical protein [Candidatus Moranbacteria bacterium]